MIEILRRFFSHARPISVASRAAGVDAREPIGGTETGEPSKEWHETDQSPQRPWANENEAQQRKAEGDARVAVKNADVGFHGSLALDINYQ